MKSPVSLFIVFLVSCLAFTAGAQETIAAKLNSIILPSLQFADTPLSDALTFVQQKSLELDPEKIGVNVVILEPDLRHNPVTLTLRNVSINDAIRYTAMLAGAHMKTTKFAVTITSPPAAKEAVGEQNTAAIEERLSNIMIPSVEFNETPLTDALNFLASKSSELDSTGKGGVNIVYHGDWLHDGQVGITLRLTNIPLHETLKYTAQIADHNLEIEANAIVVSSKK